MAAYDAVGTGDALPETARLELRIAGDVGHGRDRIAQHLAFMRAVEEFALGEGQEEDGDGRLDGIDLGLRRLGGIEALPFDLGERPEIRARLAHPGAELLVGALSGTAAIENEIQMPVLAGPENAEAGARDRAARHESAGALRLLAFDVEEGRRMREADHHGGLCRDVDELALARAVALVERDQRADRGLAAGP